MSVTMREMLEAGVHFGHQTRFWNPKMAPYIFGQRNKIHIINLEKTLPLYQDAMKFIAPARREPRHHPVRRHQAPGARHHRRGSAALPACRYVDQRWLGGMLTNFKTVKSSIKRLKEMEAMAQDGTLRAHVKKEALLFQREMRQAAEAPRRHQGHGRRCPTRMFVIDVGYHKGAVTEAKKLGIPVIGVVDTNHSPDGIDYVIPGNDDSSRAIRLYARGVADAVLEGRTPVARRGRSPPSARRVRRGGRG